MAVDYDAPRPAPVGDSEEDLDALSIRRSTGTAGNPDVDETTETFDASDPGIVDEELSVPVVPMRGDEFRCERCFLVHHRSRLTDRPGAQICRDCS